VRSNPNVARTRLRPVRIEDAFPLVPLFEAFYGTYFGEAVTETAIRTACGTHGGVRCLGVSADRFGVEAREALGDNRPGQGSLGTRRPHMEEERGGPCFLSLRGVRRRGGRDAEDAESAGESLTFAVLLPETKPRIE